MKQETLEEAKQRAVNYMRLKGALKPKQIKCYCGHTTYCDCSPLEEPKQETLEEFIEREGYPEGHTQDIWETGVRDGIAWQQERSYSEEEVENILVEHTIELFKGQPCTLNEFFEQFKKK